MHKTGIFSPEDFVDKFNFDLCNDLGNLVNRTIGMVNKYFGGNIPEYVGCVNIQDQEIEELAENQVKKLDEKINEFQFSGALDEIWEIISKSNKYIDETAPWVLAKDETQKEKLASVMYHLVENIRIVAILLKAFMPETSQSILEQLGINEKEFSTWKSIQKYNKDLKELKVIEIGKPLFVRLNKDEEIEYLKNEMQK